MWVKELHAALCEIQPYGCAALCEIQPYVNVNLLRKVYFSIVYGHLPLLEALRMQPC